MDELVDEDLTPSKKLWRCEECGYEDYNKPMPNDRIKFYDKVHRGIIPKCPKCHSEGFMPNGY